MTSRESYKISFALALYELLNESKELKKNYAEVTTVLKVLDENPEFISMNDDLFLDFAKKEKLIKEAFKQINPVLLNAMLILAESGCFTLLQPILKKLKELIQVDLKIKEGIVYSTIKLSDQKIKELEKKVTKDLEIKVSLENQIDKELIGGFKIVVDDYVVEDSVKSHLENLKQQLLNKTEGEL